MEQKKHCYETLKCYSIGSCLSNSGFLVGLVGLGLYALGDYKQVGAPMGFSGLAACILGSCMAVAQDWYPNREDSTDILKPLTDPECEHETGFGV